MTFQNILRKKGDILVGATDITALCHQNVGKPVRLQLTDGTIMDGVIHEVLPDGIMFAPYDGPIPMKGTTAGNKKTALGHDATHIQVKPAQFFFGGFGFFPFFIPFFGIVGLW